MIVNSRNDMFCFSLASLTSCATWSLPSAHLCLRPCQIIPAFTFKLLLSLKYFCILCLQNLFALVLQGPCLTFAFQVRFLGLVLVRPTDPVSKSLSELVIWFTFVLTEFRWFIHEGLNGFCVFLVLDYQVLSLPLHVQFGFGGLNCVRHRMPWMHWIELRSGTDVPSGLCICSRNLRMTILHFVSLPDLSLIVLNEIYCNLNNLKILKR